MPTPVFCVITVRLVEGSTPSTYTPLLHDFRAIGRGFDSRYQQPVLQQHRFSSEEDDIVEARLSDEDMFPPVKTTERRKSYFEDVMEEIQQNKEEKGKEQKHGTVDY